MTADTKSQIKTVNPENAREQSWWSLSIDRGWILLLLAAIIVAFTTLAPDRFASIDNFRNIAIDASILLLLGLGQTFVIVTRGIDLSVGSTLVLASVTSTQVMLALGGDAAGGFGRTDAGPGVVLIGAVVALATGAIVGALNGVLIAYTKLPPLIVTLGTLGIALGVAQIITNGQDVRAVPGWLVDTIGVGELAGVPVLVIIAAVIAVVAGILLHATRFGEWTLAVGSNPEAARRAGIPIRHQLVAVYVISGVLAGLAGILSVARFGTTTIGGHGNDNLAAVSAVVLGGTSLFGGVGTILGTCVALFIPVVLANGFVILGIPPFWQTVSVGVVLIVAVLVDQIRRRRRASQ